MSAANPRFDIKVSKGKAVLDTTLRRTNCQDGDIPYQQMHKHFKGARVYLAELDVHFAELILGQTLGFAASARNQASHHSLARTVAEQLELTDSVDTKVGNAMIRGISGGEKRRTSIAETLIGGALFQCWDNCTRGLDSLTALRIVKLFRELTNSARSTVAMSLYQASQEMYSVRIS